MGGGGRASGRGVQGGSGPHPHIRGAAAGSAGRQLPGRKASLGFARVHSSEVKAIFLLMFPNVETLANDSKNCITWRASPNRSEGQIPASGCRFADLRPRPPRALRGLQGAHPAGNRCKAPPPPPMGLAPQPTVHCGTLTDFVLRHRCRRGFWKFGPSLAYCFAEAVGSRGRAPQ